MRGKNKRIISTFIMSLILLFGNIITVHAAEEDKLKANFTYGFESVYKSGSLVPITIEIDNNFKNIDGEVQIEIPVTNTSGLSGDNSITIYAQSINLPLGSKKKVTINVPIARNLTSVKMNIVEGKNKLLTKDIALGSALNPTDFIIGTLSDDFNSVSYINKVSIDSPNTGKRDLSTKLVKLDENTLPDDLNVLKSINMIFINNFDTSKISKAKYEALKKWVENGGLLLIGTGSSYNKTLAVFKDNFISAELGQVAPVQTQSIYKAVDKNSSSSMKLDALNISSKEGKAIINEGNLSLIQRIEKGKGVVALAAFDFGLSPLADWSLNSSFGEQLIRMALPDYYNSSSYDVIANNAGGIVNNISYALGNIPELPVPKTSSLIVIFFVYILLVAPANYFILKKKDKRELMWVTVPALSIVFAVVVYFSGANTRVTKPVANILSAIEIDDKGNQIVQSYGTVITPGKSNIKVEPEADMEIRPLVSLDYYDKNSLNQSKSEKKVYSKVTQSPNTTIEFYNTGVFGQYNFIVDNNEAKKGALQSEVNFSDNKLIGTIKNNTGLNLNECYVVTPNSYISIGQIKNGEVKSINEPVKAYAGMIYDLTNKLFGVQYGGISSGVKDITERRFKEQERNLIQSYFQSTGDRIRKNVILAISDTPVTKDVTVNGQKIKKYGKSLVVSNLELSYIKEGKAEYPTGSIIPVVNSIDGQLKYDEAYGFIAGASGNVEIKYSIDKNVKVEKIQLKEAQQMKDGPNFPPLKGKGYVWNVSKNSWEECDYYNFTLEGDKASSYVDSNNVFKLKVDTTGQTDPGTIPQIYVKGSVK